MTAALDEDDTAYRHEVRWYVAGFRPSDVITPRVREALSRMSAAGAAQERRRIAENPDLASWHEVLSQEVP